MDGQRPYQENSLPCFVLIDSAASCLLATRKVTVDQPRS
jgi:hypothetical protein